MKAANKPTLKAKLSSKTRLYRLNISSTCRFTNIRKDLQPFFYNLWLAKWQIFVLQSKSNAIRTIWDSGKGSVYKSLRLGSARGRYCFDQSQSNCLCLFDHLIEHSKLKKCFGKFGRRNTAPANDPVTSAPKSTPLQILLVTIYSQTTLFLGPALLLGIEIKERRGWRRWREGEDNLAALINGHRLPVTVINEQANYKKTTSSFRA